MVVTSKRDPVETRLGGSDRKSTLVCVGFPTKRDSAICGQIYVDVRNPRTSRVGLVGLARNSRWCVWVSRQIEIWISVVESMSTSVVSSQIFMAGFGGGHWQNPAAGKAKQVVSLKSVGLFE
jgi:hypothetical protein